MVDATLQLQVDAAKAYEAVFVPALFGQWAARVADAAKVETGHRVLDVACGTGILARAIHARVGATGSVAGLDPNPGMLAVANEIAPEISWRSGFAESMPFPDQSFDAVVSQFGLMFFADRDKALREMLRVLVPHGRLVVAVWDALANIPAYSDEVALLERVAGPRAADALRLPFVLGDRQLLSALFGNAGAVDTAVTTEVGKARFPSIRVMVEADLRGWLPVMGVNLTEDRIGHILQEAERVLAGYVGPDGDVSFRMQAHVVVATKAWQGGTMFPGAPSGVAQEPVGP